MWFLASTEVVESSNSLILGNQINFTDMPISFAKFGKSLPFSRLFRKLEQDMETVVKVLQPGPLGIIEHKFSTEEIHEATDTVKRAVENWQRNANIEKRSPILKDYVN